MSALTLAIDGDAGGAPLPCVPGAQLMGEATWRLDRDPTRVEIRLFWYTVGKGTQDVCVIDTVVCDQPPITGSQRFRFSVPVGPYSFSGTLVSLLWAIELVIEPGGPVARRELVITANGREVQLSQPGA